MRILLPILLAAFATHAQAQEVSDKIPASGPFSESFFSLQYNDVTADRALSLTYHQPFGERGWRAYIGLRYHVHKPKSDVASQGSYNKSLFARNGFEHFGIKAGFEKGYAVFKKYPTELFGFWDTQLSHGALQATPYETYDSVNRSIVTVFGTPSGNVTYWENHFGLGLRSQVTEQFGYRIFGGVGIAAINEPNGARWMGRSPLLASWVWQPSCTFGFGVDYHLR